MAAKIVWLCNWSDASKLRHVRRWRDVGESYGVWIPDLLRGFVGDGNFEIHVVTYTLWQRKLFEEWCENGVYFHSYQFGIPFLGYYFPWFFPFDRWTNYFFNRIRIHHLINRIKPDIVHLFGAENQCYSCTIPRLKKRYQVLTTLQGFYTRQIGVVPDTKGFRASCENEIRVLKACDHFTGEYDSLEYVRKIRGGSMKLSAAMYFPINEELVKDVVAKNLPKKYDVVFCARLCVEKGIEDFVRMAAILQGRGKKLSYAIAGPGRQAEYIYSLCSRLGLPDRHAIDFLGRLPSQEDVYRLFASARTYVIPTYNDAFPTTIRENMLLGTPCVAYATGGIPYANNDGNENVVLVKQGDVPALADRVVRLLENAEERRELISRARSFAERTFALAANAEIIKGCYNGMLKGSK